MRTVEDTQVSDLLAHWIAEQQQRDDLCQRERPRIGILAACGYVRDGGWPSYGGDAPTMHAVLEAGGFPCLIPTLSLIEGYDPWHLLSDDHAFTLLFRVIWPVVRELDGLILTGGGDLIPICYLCGKIKERKICLDTMWKGMNSINGTSNHTSGLASVSG